MNQLDTTANTAPRGSTVEERLLAERGELWTRLEEVDQAIEALRSNPDIAALLTIISKATDRYY